MDRKEREGEGLKPPQSKFSGYVAGYVLSQYIVTALNLIMRARSKLNSNFTRVIIEL